MQPVPGPREAALTFAKELVAYGIREMLARPRAVTSPWPPASARPSECPWCAVARDVAGALIYVQRAQLKPPFAPYYRTRALAILDDLRVSLVRGPGEMYRLLDPVLDAQDALRGATSDLAVVVGILGELIDRALTRAEGPSPVPYRVNENGRPMEGPRGTGDGDHPSTDATHP